MRYLAVTGFCFCVLLFNCTNNAGGAGKTRLVMRVQAAYHKKIILQQHGFNGETPVNVDSGVVQTGLDTFVFTIPEGEERLFTINVAESSIRIPYINDTKNAELYYNYATRRYNVKNSPASEGLKAFFDAQLQLSGKLNILKFRIDSMQKIKPAAVALKDSIEIFNSLNTDFFERYKNFADTVHSPAAFLAVYDAIIFGSDRTELKTFITKALTRFPHNSAVQKLAKNVFDYLKVFEGQYKIGDTLPELVLPDEYGINFSTYSLKGKYVLIDIWSTLCNDCVKYAGAIKKAKQLLPAEKFEAVSIAVDDEKQQWINIISRNKYNWPQLIDIDMWKGQAFKTLKFDSIPYNFLVAPDGKLIKKNISADSIITVMQQVIK
jgi:thiol-disulfide isomerase/thioredoxin